MDKRKEFFKALKEWFKNNTINGKRYDFYYGNSDEHVWLGKSKYGARVSLRVNIGTNNEYALDDICVYIDPDENSEKLKTIRLRMNYIKSKISYPLVWDFNPDAGTSRVGRFGKLSKKPLTFASEPNRYILPENGDYCYDFDLDVEKCAYEMAKFYDVFINAIADNDLYGVR